jgi:hypothetical protein
LRLSCSTALLSFRMWINLEFSNLFFIYLVSRIRRESTMMRRSYAILACKRGVVLAWFKNTIPLSAC